MKIAEGCQALAHVAFQNTRSGLTEIYDDQAVDYVGKFTVQIEGYQFVSHLGVLTDQDRDSFAVFFEVGDGFGEFVQITDGIANGGTVPAQYGRAEGSARPD